jgi:hypothetical protein
MPPARKLSPTPLLLEPDYWRRRVAEMEDLALGLLILPRPDIAQQGMEVVEWRLRAHDGLRLWGLRCQSSFHVCPTGARIRQVETCQRPDACFDAVCEGRVDFVYQVPAGRKLEDRVLDVLRVLQLAASYSSLAPGAIALEGDSDELMIAAQLVAQGLLD